MANFSTWVLVFAILSLSKSGFVPPAEWCLPSAHLKELSGCVAMTDLEDECGTKQTEDAKLDCYCSQEMLSSYFACQDDITRCLESHMFDPQFEYKVKRWHEACDSRMTTTLTTPPVTSLTATYDFGACSRLQRSCIRGDYETNKCSQTYLPSSSLSYASCACQPSIYSLFSECQYNGNISCKRTTAAESNILGYSYCSYFWSGSETLSSIDLTSALGITGQMGSTSMPTVAFTPLLRAASIRSMISGTVPITADSAKETVLNRFIEGENGELR
ncbi:hypothetical protein BCR34DRAFT_600472 [Clohesyomyces aquaticus]|uniref:Extracellular membrane protein CFEM domain-containing protein n=1 Tax=Clohesyomyces aquaticus TaxID=1231657 RepID=A0A1Y1ZQQ2_9PLEO|nr:hypothetical protein BCR34DRAFT_600472 [Clohesyomyces aquaticus]